MPTNEKICSLAALEVQHHSVSVLITILDHYISGHQALVEQDIHYQDISSDNINIFIGDPNCAAD